MPYGVKCQRSAASIAGPATRWLKDKAGEIALFATEEEARAEAKRVNTVMHNSKLSYHAAPYDGSRDRG